MTKKVSLFLALMMGLIIYDINYNVAHTNGTGAPAGRTGNPGEFGGLTCSQPGCHTGPPVTNESVSVSSTVPGTGYVAGETYTVTVTMTKFGGTKFGFEISPQTNNGALLGTLSNPGSGTQFIGNNKYVTHTFIGTGGTDAKTWTFDWTAPASGMGPVTFWGAFNFANGNNSTSGDVILNDTYTVSESTVSVDEVNFLKNGFVVYPNPAEDQVNVDVNAQGELKLKLFSLDGKLINTLNHDIYEQGIHHFSANLSGLSSGIYVLEVINNGKVGYEKLLIK